MMNYALVPHWFSGYNAFLEMIFFAITLLVGVYALRVHKLSGQKRTKVFGIAFIMISLAYLVQSALNFAARFTMVNGCSMKSMTLMHSMINAGTYAYLILFTAGLVILSYTALKIKEIIALAVFFALAFLIILSKSPIYVFYIISSILLIYISFYYLGNYLKSKQKSSLLVFVAFLFLLFGKIHFIFSTNHGTFYVAGHLLELVAYSLILMNLVMVTRRK